jgi:hypothetical protein
VLRTDTDGSVQVTIAADGAIGVTETGARKVADQGPQLAAATPLLVRPGSAFACGIPSRE